MPLRRHSLAVAVVAAGIALASCSSPHPRRDPVGEKFPSVEGTSLDGKKVAIPDDFAGAPVLLLAGYEQNAQFDLDRWLLGLDLYFETTGGRAPKIVEVPTIPGLISGLFAGQIDQGMRSGIPSEDWASVVTVYGDGGAIARFTGNENGNTGRVLLLDGAGRVAFFHDRGYSVGTLKNLVQALERIEGGGAR